MVTSVYKRIYFIETLISASTIDRWSFRLSETFVAGVMVER
jgi:hypothetical protein